MRNIPDGISDADLIRRLKDKIAGFQRQIELQKKSNNQLFDMNSKLIWFMNCNDFWKLYHKQRDELKLND